MIEWDTKYYIFIRYAMEEFHATPIARTEGCYLILPDGTKILDFLSGLISVNAGQRNEKIIEAIKEAMENYSYLWEVFTNPYKAEAAKLIIEDILGPDGWAGKVRFVNSGSEANEEALMIARLFTNKPIIVSREFAYHGWTLGASSCTRLQWWRGAIASPKDPNNYRDVLGFEQGISS